MGKIEIDAIIDHGVIHLMVSVGLWLLVIVAILIDLWDGVYTAKCRQERIHSHKLRETVAKISEYWRLMLVGFVVDTVGVLFPWWLLPYLSIILCIGLVGVEAKSIMEHARKRKSHTLEMSDVYDAIIKAASRKDARKAIEAIINAGATCAMDK